LHPNSLGDPVAVQRGPWQETATRRIEETAQKLGTKPRDDMVEYGAKVADWKYYDLHGNIIASVARYESEAGEKTYRPFCFRDGKWAMGAPDVRPLYNLPRIVTCQHVVLVEGEKCAQALIELGIDATTAMQGAKAPLEKTDWSPLRGKRITIWPDADAPGFEYSEAVSATLRGIDCEVAIVTPPAGKSGGWDAADAIAEGIDPHTIIAAAGKPPPGRFAALSWRDLAHLPPPVWAIDGFIPEGGFVGVYGPSGAFKSFIVLDMAACLATGRDWHGHKVRQCTVVYIAAEGQRGVSKRIRAWEQERQRVDNFYVIPAAPTFPADLDALCADLLSVPKPGLIVIDTLARTFHGSENDGQDMGIWIRAVGELQRRFGATVMFVHHSGKDAEKKDRGHTSLRGAADCMMRIDRSGDTREVAARVDKQKDDEELSKPLRMVSVELGIGEDGKPITSLVAVANEAVVAPKEPKDMRLGAAEKRLLDAMRQADELGRPALKMHTIELLFGDKRNARRTIESLLEKAKIYLDQDGSYVVVEQII
jgi:hypothetical protein